MPGEGGWAIILGFQGGVMKSLEKYAKRLETDWKLVRIRRVMWIDMDARVREIFKEIDGSPHAHWYGNLYIHSGLHPDVQKYYVTERMNQLQVTCGIRLLGLRGIEEVEETKVVDDVEQTVKRIKPKTHMEKEAAMWFSQAPAGGVTVFMSPYKSDIANMSEKEIIIGFFKDPTKLTDRKIRKMFSRFFKYLSISSAYHQHTALDYAWRLWLMYLDIRSRKFWKAFVAINALIIFGGALVTVLAYLLQSPKP